MKNTDFELLKRLTEKNTESVKLIQSNMKAITETLTKANENGENIKPSQRDIIVPVAKEFNDTFQNLMQDIVQEFKRGGHN